MNEDEIIKYIKNGLSRGLDLMEIKQSCLSHGWSDYDISKALRDSGIEIREKEAEEEKKIEEKEKEDNSIEGWDLK